jgi:exopolyphosphatase
LSEVNKTPAVPLIQVERPDLNLRPENIYALNLAGLSDPLDELLTLTEVSEFKPFPSYKFALVDHNRLGSTYSLDNPKAEVVAVIDHHEDEKLYPKASPSIIESVGSCTSLVATQLPPEPLPDLALLLLTGVLIDTDGLKHGGKAKQTDRDSALLLTSKSTIANSIPALSADDRLIDIPNPDVIFESQAIKDLTKCLEDKKADVSKLGAFDLIRRDYKEYTHPLPWVAGSPSIKVGLSTVPSALKSWGTDGKLEEAAVRWIKQRKITALGICTSFRDTQIIGKKGKGKHKREQAWIILTEPELAGIANEGLTADILAKRLWAGLEAAETPSLELGKYKKFSYLEKGKRLPAESRARAYKQGNVDANRKVIAPLVKSILEDASTKKDGETTEKKGVTKNAGDKK